MEQQAEIIADYFLKKKKIEELLARISLQKSNLSYSFLEQSLSHQCSSIKDYEKVLEGHLPIDKSCQENETKKPKLLRSFS
jgi:hypothetical protein